MTPSTSASTSPSTGLSYDSVRASVDSSTTNNLSRVEVNQRALIDKILARYASAGAVYRELLQNSNDAEADTAEIYFTVDQDPTASSGGTAPASSLSSSASGGMVRQVVYQNNGLPFRPQDWSRLQKIAEGNPDVTKVGAFGVGAYTMFSICEEPLIISGSQALAFVWQGDSLWTKTAPRTTPPSPWTTFVLPSRDPYPLPDLVEFGEFLCASLTFTKSLRYIRVLVNDTERLSIVKTLVEEPRKVAIPKSSSSSSSSSWFISSTSSSNSGAAKSNGAVTSSPQGVFFLGRNDTSIYETMYRISVVMDGDLSSLDARYISATAHTHISADMARRMERVTKKSPPPQVPVHIFLHAQRSGPPTSAGVTNKAAAITESFLPPPGAGRIFIGFRTSQTTGLAAHVAAPFVPTVEREAMDLQDPTLRLFNLELLEFAGILMRLALEHAMVQVLHPAWQKDQKHQDQLIQAMQQHVESSLTTRSSSTPLSTTTANGGTLALTTNGEAASASSTGTLVNFARYMARGVKNRIASVVSSVERMMDDGSQLMHPRDQVPLSSVEQQAIALMQSFCPQPSTPDPLVGTALAQGFSRCLPGSAPPVLTRTGVVRGDQGRLPCWGMEAFVLDRVVRGAVLQETEQYHQVIANCRQLQLEDLIEHLKAKVLDEPTLVYLLHWWVKYGRADSKTAAQNSTRVKELIRYHSDDPLQLDTKGQKRVVALHSLLFYVEKESTLNDPLLPMPAAVIPMNLQEKIGMATLSDPFMWFTPLPIEIWAEFISHHSALQEAKPQDDTIRVAVLSVLCREFLKRPLAERRIFGAFCQNLLANKRCIPFDSIDQGPSADCPSALYLPSAELKAFDGVGTFYKVSDSLRVAGVTDEFLLALGVRKSVSVEFLFTNLDTLDWGQDPKPLVEYLRTATLTRDDIMKLASTKYLPTDRDSARHAPSKLYLPNAELKIFPFVSMLKWPSESDLSEQSANGKFLISLGMKTVPPLLTVISYTAQHAKDDEERIRCLDFICERLGPHGKYSKEYATLSYAQRKGFRVLPCMVRSPFQPDTSSKELQSPVTCFMEESSALMEFPVLDPSLSDRRVVYGGLLQCPVRPEANLLINQLSYLVAKAKSLQQEDKSNSQDDRILSAVGSIFRYLSQRTDDLSESSLSSIRNDAFIPCVVNKRLEWLLPNQVFFRPTHGSVDELTEELFPLVEFSPFLAAAGVKQEASTSDLFQRMLRSPEDVMRTLGSEKKYRVLLRRIAANPPFSKITPEIQNTPFLLAYSFSQDTSNESSGKYKLARAKDIFVVDNAFYARMFAVQRAPHESDLEDFYVQLGSPYLSQTVEKRFEVVGRPDEETTLTRALRERINERGPLLVSPNITSRPLVNQAASVLSERRLKIFQTSNLMAVYSLRGEMRRSRTTCFSRSAGGKINAIYIVSDFDWFDVGGAIGDLILKRCQLEDAFFISSLLEAPLDQLKARGFPVERILHAEPEIVPAEKVPPQAPVKPAPVNAKPAPVVNNQVAEVPPEQLSLPNSGTGESGSGENTPVPSTLGPQPGKSNDEESTTDGFQQILQQMFPGADPGFIRSALGPDPSLEDVRSLAEAMAAGNYPNSSDEKTKSGLLPNAGSHEADGPMHSPLGGPKDKGLRKRLGRAFGGLRGSSFGGVGPSTIAAPTTTSSKPYVEKKAPVPPVVDAQTQSSLESMLERAVSTSASVGRNDIDTPQTTLTSIPEGLSRGETCEVINSQSLQVFPGPRGNGMTQNQIRLFASKRTPSSEHFLRENESAVENFSVVIARLCDVYGLNVSSVAIYHEPAGETIAFNRRKALHFNFRFFYALHFLPHKYMSSECYAYWYVVMAHELAHHLVYGHGKEHGFYTESYAAHYLPRLVDLLRTL